MYAATTSLYVCCCCCFIVEWKPLKMKRQIVVLKKKIMKLKRNDENQISIDVASQWWWSFISFSLSLFVFPPKRDHKYDLLIYICSLNNLKHSSNYWMADTDGCDCVHTALYTLYVYMRRWNTHYTHKCIVKPFRSNSTRFNSF